MLREWIRIAVILSVGCGMFSLDASAPFQLSADGTTVYDTANNVTWLANADLPATNRFGLPVCDGTVNTKTCVNASGSMSYQAAAAWVAAMNAANYLGHNTWQIPTSPIRDNSVLTQSLSSRSYFCRSGVKYPLCYCCVVAS